jgi:hypothetical protein
MGDAVIVDGGAVVTPERRWVPVVLILVTQVLFVVGLAVAVHWTPVHRTPCPVQPVSIGP